MSEPPMAMHSTVGKSCPAHTSQAYAVPRPASSSTHTCRGEGAGRRRLVVGGASGGCGLDRLENLGWSKKGRWRGKQRRARVEARRAASVFKARRVRGVPEGGFPDLRNDLALGDFARRDGAVRLVDRIDLAVVPDETQGVCACNGHVEVDRHAQQTHEHGHGPCVRRCVAGAERAQGAAWMLRVPEPQSLQWRRLNGAVVEAPVAVARWPSSWSARTSR
eukprot:5704970-Pleurochrysis_carterae.AAC.2